MSIKEPRAKDSAVASSSGQDLGQEPGQDKGFPAPTITNQRKNTEYPNLNIGNPGNKGGSGRPAERIRLKATESLESQIVPIGNLLKVMVERATSELGKQGSLDKGLATMREIGRIANTLTSIGPGTKVTNVLEDDRLLEVFDQAMQDAGVPTELHVRVLENVRSHIKG